MHTRQSTTTEKCNQTPFKNFEHKGKVISNGLSIREFMDDRES